ncbi:MAG: hypothetical protein QNJ61_03820 [Desulfobacterales bacterium]|nr:hypothetical protein [Desulfobacterales bacterium]
MQPENRFMLLAVLAAIVSLMACAAPITYPVRITYTGQAPIATEDIGRAALQVLQDERDSQDAYRLGRRKVGTGAFERYVSAPENVALSISDALAELLQRKGLQVRQIKGWDFSPENMLARAGDNDFLIGGVIRKFNCEAEKGLMHTRMIMEIELELQIGRVGLKKVDRRPVDIRMERTEPTFGADKFQYFMNDMLAQVLEKGLKDVP